MVSRIASITSIGLLALLAGCGGGGGGGSPPPPPPPPPVDTTPDAITFTSQSGTALSTAVSSNAVTITGINAAAAVSITGGEYSIGGGAFTSAAGTVSNNQTITVRINSSGQFSTQATATLTVGGVSTVFTVTTLAADTTPDAFAFTAGSSSAARNVVLTSSNVTITGLNTGSPISIANGEYSINGGAFTAAAGTVANNQQVTVRLTTSGQFSTAVNAVLTVGGVTGTFSATTLAEDTVPDAFTFQRSANNLRDSLVVSNSVTIAGINNTTPVSIQNGEFSVAGGAYRTTAATIEPGQSITVRARSSSVYSKSTQATVTIGGVSASFVVSTEVPDYTPEKVEFDGTDVVFLLSGANRLVFRWSLAGERYLDPYELSQSLEAPTHMVWSGAHQRLYFGYSRGAIRYINPAASSATVTDLVTMTGGLYSLSSAGNFLAVQTSQYSYSGGRIVNSSGVVTASQAGYYYGYSRETAWDPVKSRLYYFRDGISPNDLHYDVINQTSGAITSSGETPYHGDYSFYGPIRVSANGQRVLLGAGDIYSQNDVAQNDLMHTGWLGNPVNDARWMADGSVITLRTANNQTVLRRRGSNTQLTLEQIPYTGGGLRVVGTDARMAVLVVDNGELHIHTYVPSDDSDGDGVSNTTDAFPLDVAASVDTDRDGYPDAWNSGRSQADSTSGLSLDAFAQDSACWLASHGSAGACNYTATLPDYEPDQVISHGDIVYLLSRDNRRVYRWSISAAQYLNPYTVGNDQDFSTFVPTMMTYSSAHQRLYLVYATGDINYIDVTAASPVEVPFTSTGGVISQVASAGNFIVAHVSTNYYTNYSHVIDSSGVLRDYGGSYYSATDMTWDPVTSRLYYVVSSYNLFYDVINQATGEVTSVGQSIPGGSNLVRPARVSVNGQRILVGSGDLFSSTAWTGSLGAQLADARWFTDGALVTLTTASNQTALRRLDGPTLGTLEQLSYTGRALRVVGSDTRMAVVLFDGDTVQFRIYVPDNDSDDDGVPNTQDAFPQDPAASVDSDLDGYPDAWNAGRSQADSTTNPALTLDVFASDSGCWLQAHGSGGVCNPASTVPNYTPDKIEQSGNIVYLLSNANRRVYRWSISGQQYLNPYVVGLNPGLTTLAPTTMALSSTHQRLYLGYSNGAVRYIGLNAATPSEVAFTSFSAAINSLSYAGNFLLVQPYPFSNYGGYVVDSAGVIRDQGGYYYGYSRETSWDATHSRVYFYRDGISPNDLHYEVIDQTSGEITGNGETPYHGDYSFGGVARVSGNGDYILTGGGDIFSRTGMTWSGSVGMPITDARWFANGSVATLTTATNQTQLRRLGSTNLNVLEQRVFAGEALRVVGSDAAMVVIVNNNGAVQFHSYVPNDDSDNDGVQNTSDAFPLDVAASVDTDRDGYPDAWNAGRSQADSTSVPQLVLDAFPNDSACWLASHGSGGVCNYGATIPNYTPDQVVQAGNVVYLLSAANKRVYRWSISAGAYINPYIVGVNQGFTTLAPTKMEYSANHQRLYLGYSNGAIRYLDTTSGAPAETPFLTMSGTVNRLTSAGNFLVAHVGYYYSSLNNYVIDSGGVTRDIGGSYYGAYDTSWDPVNSRLYYTASGYYSLYYDVINQSTGEFGTTVSSNYYNTYLSPPIRVSPDGQRILMGSGTVLSQSNLIPVGFLTTQFTDARWFADDSVALLVQTGNLTTLTHQAVANTSLETRQYTGQPLRIVGSDSAMAVLVLNNGTVQIHSYVPSTDSDGDGVLNTADAFPTDVAASVDADGDGHPDAWNAGYDETDSTTGLTLDLFPADITCWAANHGSGGNCNYNVAINANYRPDQIARNGDIVYLLSSVNRRVYRWSTATGEYLSPYVVGGNLPYASLAPKAMAYSPAHQRLYLGYSTGAVRYIDVNAATPAETAFTTLSDQVNVLADAGNFLLAQPTGNAAGLVLNSNGVTMDTNDYYYGYSTNTTWDPVNSRVYYAGSGTLRYQVIDQATGQIGTTGESAYSGQAFGGPIRVSPDGSQIVVGNGNVYARNNLTLTGSLGKSVVDVQWQDNLLVDVDPTALVEIRDATTLAVLQTHQQVGAPLGLAFGSSEAYLVHFLNDMTVAFWRMPFYDLDGDTIPAWWEQLYAQGGAGMNDANAADATTDLDSDGVNNLLEYQNHSNPLVTDTDADGLSDQLEIVTHHTSPARADTDGDGLSDHAEVATHLTDPLDTDSDNDNFSDQVEVLYGGNPNNAGVLPQPLTSYSQTFEGSPNLSAWITPAQPGAPWAVSASAAHSGSAGFRSGAVGNSQSSIVRFRGYLRPGTLSFWARIDTNSCCHRLYVTVNGGSPSYITSSSQWYQYSIQIPNVGVHEIEWRFERDYYGGQSTDTANIDDVVFVGQ